MDRRSCSAGRWHRRLAWAVCLEAAVLWANDGHAQYLQNYFPEGVPGYDKDMGVTVLSRVRPLYDPPGVRVGQFVIRPRLDESIGYNSNVIGSGQSPGSWYLDTAPSVSVDSQWARNRLGAYLSVDNTTYFETPKQNTTNVVASVGGGYTIGRSDLTLAYSFMSLNELPTDIGALPTTTPVPYQVNDIRSDYTFDFGRLSLIPNVEFQTYRFGNTTLGGVPVSQTYRNRDVVQGGVTALYKITDQQNGLVVLRGVNQNYVSPQIGQPSNNSNSVLLLAGVESKYTGAWRYRLLVGLEMREFQASQYESHTAPIVEANVVWTPSGRTTVTGIVRRAIEDAAQEGTSGYTLSSAGLVLDQELYHNILAQGRAQFQYAQPLQGGGTATNYSFGAGLTWLVNRNVRMSANYDYSDQKGSNNGLFSTFIPGTINQQLITSTYTRSLFLLTLRLAL